MIVSILFILVIEFIHLCHKDISLTSTKKHNPVSIAPPALKWLICLNPLLALSLLEINSLHTYVPDHIYRKDLTSHSCSQLKGNTSYPKRQFKVSP